MNVNGRLSFENLTGDPTVPSPVEGDLYYNSTDKGLKIYDGSSWNGVGGGAYAIIERKSVSAVANVEFTSIPSGYDFLQVEIAITTSGAGNLRLAIDNLTTGYFQIEVQGGTALAKVSGLQYFELCRIDSTGNCMITVKMPSNPTTNKIGVTVTGAGFDYDNDHMLYGTVTGTGIDPKNSIKITSASGTVTGVVTLLGIKNS